MVAEPKADYPQKKETPKPTVTKKTAPGVVSDFGFSISKPGNLGKASPKKNTEQVADKIDQTAARDAFTLDQLITLWKTFASKLTQPSEIPVASILNSIKPTLEGDTQLHLELHSKTQESEFDKIKSTLIPFLRKSLNNFHIGITITVNIASKNLTPYTAEEKFSHMAEKNESLRKLRAELNLDLGH